MPIGRKRQRKAPAPVPQDAKISRSTYNANVHPTQVHMFACQGYDDIQIAVQLQIDVVTFRNWRKKHTDFDSSYLAGKAEWNDSIGDQVENALIKKAMSGDVKAAEFVLKNIRPDKWKDSKHVTNTDLTPEVHERTAQEELAEIRKTMGIQKTGGDGTDPYEKTTPDLN